MQPGRIVVGVLAVLIAAGLTSTPVAAEQSTGNAISSEGNGAAVFIGYGGDRQVQLSWRPSKQFETSTMLYQVQRSDGPMLESKTRSTSFTDRNLQPNTSYTYNLTVFQTVSKSTVVKGVRTVKSSVKRVGENSITVVTLPTMVVNLKAVCTSTTALRIWWEKPQNADLNPLTYSVVFADNVVASGLSAPTLSFTIDDLNLRPYRSKEIQIIAENATGPARLNASIVGPVTLPGITNTGPTRCNV